MGEIFADLLIWMASFFAVSAVALLVAHRLSRRFREQYERRLLEFGLTNVKAPSGAATARENRLPSSKPHLTSVPSVPLHETLELLRVRVACGEPVESAIAKLAEQLARRDPQSSARLKESSERPAQRHVALIRDLQSLDPQIALRIQTLWEGNDPRPAETLRDAVDRLRKISRDHCLQASESVNRKLRYPLLLCLVPAVYLILLGPIIIEIVNFFSR